MPERGAATSTSWKRQPFTTGSEIPYRSNFTSEQFARLRTGLVPGAMEDKWFIYYDQPFLFLHRSWTGQPVYRLKLSVVDEGAEVEQALWCNQLSADARRPELEYQARLLDFLISNLLLGQRKPFPVPPNASKHPNGILQHHISGTAFPE